MKCCVLVALGLVLAGCGSGTASHDGESANALKGVAFSPANADCADLSRLGVSWFYDWSGSTACTAAEFVPQIWGSWQKLQWVHSPAETVANGARELLGFNEPDGSDQSNIPVDEALRLWPDMQQPGVLLGSPATAAQAWEESFMAEVAAQNLRVDFIAMHWYGWDPGSCDNVSSLEAKIEWAEQWQRPIWITEWSCRAQPAAVVQKFYSDARVMFKAHPLVQRYAWFLTRSASDPAQTAFSNATLLDQSGAPSALGNEYIAAPSYR